MAIELMMVELFGGPWDGHRQELLDPEQPREAAGTWMLLPGGVPWPDDVPAGCVPRAVYEPGPAPEPVDRWLYQGTIYI